LSHEAGNELMGPDLSRIAPVAELVDWAAESEPTTDAPNVSAERTPIVAVPTTMMLTNAASAVWIAALWAGFNSPAKWRPWPKRNAGAEKGGGVRRGRYLRSATDSEHFGPAVGTGPLRGLFPILHGDALRAQDVPLRLASDAICICGSSHLDI
jgi:hypothetical protein